MITINLLKKLKKEPKKIALHSVAKGNLIAITDVKDDVFSQKMLGDGFAVVPSEESIYSPVDGIVTSVFPTKHAIGLKTKENIEILLHIGIDTVELKGEPFDIFVKEGEVVSPKTLLARVDLQMLENHNKMSDILTVITSNNHSGLTLNILGSVNKSHNVGYIELT